MMSSEIKSFEVAHDPLSEVMELQMGPSHPASHGTIKFNLRLDGETIDACGTEIGYLHRGFEKMCEQGTWTQAIPYTDRLNYASPFINNFIFCEAAERLCGLEIPERASYLRVILSETARIADHLTCMGMGASEMGAITAGFYMVETREELYNLAAWVSGARVTVSYGRLGGLVRDVPEGFEDRVRAILEKVETTLATTEKLLERNRIFLDRMCGIGIMTAEDALSFGLTGPLLRATGVAHDVRKSDPYMVYDRMDFDICVGSKGDNFDRFNVRFEEVLQSVRIVRQALDQLPGGPTLADDPRFVLPAKRDVYENIEGLMNHFKLVIEGARVPAGEVYFSGEGANGELGFYLVSDGSGRPYRVRVRPPCFYGMASVETMIRGHSVSDLVAVFGMVNMIGGECDR
ncbi:MAG: NADH-quinone oxidoreductase subunit D [Hyphomicrobiaceae bacterium]|jgi:NADH-quinone oxidoreductase subunit D